MTTMVTLMTVRFFLLPHTRAFLQLRDEGEGRELCFIAQFYLFFGKHFWLCWYPSSFRSLCCYFFCCYFFSSRVWRLKSVRWWARDNSTQASNFLSSIRLYSCHIFLCFSCLFICPLDFCDFFSIFVVFCQFVFCS